MNRYHVWDEEHGAGPEEARSVDAFDHQQAAEEYAETVDPGSDYCYAMSSEHGATSGRIRVLCEETGVQKTFTIGVERRLVYSAEEVGP